MIKKIENRKNQTTNSMSGIPSLKRSSAMSCDETDKLIRKTIKYLTRLQSTMDSWHPEEAKKTRMQLLKILRPLDEEEDEMDDGIDTSNIVVGKRQTRSVVRYEDEQFADLMLADVPDDEIDAALDEDVSDDDKDDDEMIDEDDEDWVAEEDEDWVDEDEEVENNLGRNRGQFLAETKEDDEE